MQGIKKFSYTIKDSGSKRVTKEKQNLENCEKHKNCIEQLFKYWCNWCENLLKLSNCFINYAKVHHCGKVFFTPQSPWHLRHVIQMVEQVNLKPEVAIFTKHKNTEIEKSRITGKTIRKACTSGAMKHTINK